MGIAFASLGGFNYPLGDYLADELRQISFVKLGTRGVECLAHDVSGVLVESGGIRPNKLQDASYGRAPLDCCTGGSATELSATDA